MAGRPVLLGLGGLVEDSGAYAAGIRRWDRIAFLLHYVINPARRVTANNRSARGSTVAGLIAGLEPEGLIWPAVAAGLAGAAAGGRPGRAPGLRLI
jgi:hypothetical protein